MEQGTGEAAVSDLILIIQQDTAKEGAKAAITLVKVGHIMLKFLKKILNKIKMSGSG